MLCYGSIVLSDDIETARGREVSTAVVAEVVSTIKFAI